MRLHCLILRTWWFIFRGADVEDGSSGIFYALGDTINRHEDVIYAVEDTINRDEDVIYTGEDAIYAP